jgi:hypothetical protein
MSPSSDPRILSSLVRDYWVPLVVFDPSWRVMAWNGRAAELFSLGEAQALGRPLEDCGILPERRYGAMLRDRLESPGEVMLTSETGSKERTDPQVLVHRFRRIEEEGEHLGFLCSTSSREQAEAISGGRREAGGEVPPDRRVTSLVHDLRNSLQVISNHFELLLAEVSDAPAVARVHEIRTAVEALHRRLHNLDRWAAGEETGEPGSARARKPLTLEMGAAGEEATATANAKEDQGRDNPQR